MVRIDAKIEIALPPEKVWSRIWLSDVEKLPKWRPLVKKVTTTSKRRKGVGVTWREIHEIEGHRLVGERECIEWMENKIFAWRSTSGLTVIGSWTLKPTERGTEITVMMDLGFPQKIGGKAINQEETGARIRVGLTKDLEFMKKILEK
ncbi:MAG: SRPBCC family protein [Candidatus Bathyarchaeia archaeon]